MPAQEMTQPKASLDTLPVELRLQIFGYLVPEQYKIEDWNHRIFNDIPNATRHPVLPLLLVNKKIAVEAADAPCIGYVTVDGYLAVGEKLNTSSFAKRNNIQLIEIIIKYPIMPVDRMYSGEVNQKRKDMDEDFQHHRTESLCNKLEYWYESCAVVKDERIWPDEKKPHARSISHTWIKVSGARRLTSEQLASAMAFDRERRNEHWGIIRGM